MNTQRLIEILESFRREGYFTMMRIVGIHVQPMKIIVEMMNVESVCVGWKKKILN